MRLAGKWYNQLGSEMELTVLNGSVSGSYESKVGRAKGKYTLAGRTDTDDDAARNVGWAVSWENEKGSLDSVTAWSGQVQVIGGQEVLIAFWVLTVEVDPKSNWKSHLLGRDVFTRTPPGKEKTEVTEDSFSNP